MPARLSTTWATSTGDVLGMALTGFSAATTTAIAATDSIVTGIGKAQGQVNQRPMVVANITALRALTGASATANPVIYLMGYASSGDGGEGMFWFNASDTTTADNSGTIIVDGSSHRWYREMGGEPYSVKWFGAKGDNSTDDRTAIQNTITAVTTATAGTVYFPAGNYRISSGISTIASNVWLRGAGEGVTSLIATFASGDVLTFGNSTGANPFNVRVSDLSFNTTVNRTSGSAIRLMNCNNPRLQNFTIDHAIAQHYVGVSVEDYGGSFNHYIQNFEILGTLNNGIQLGAAGTFCNGSYISAGTCNTCLVGIAAVNVGALHWTDIECLSCTNAGFALTPASSSSQEVLFGFIKGCTGDSATSGPGWLFGGTGIVADLTLTNCWAGSNHTHGFYFAGSQINGVTLSACRSVANANHGVELTTGYNITITGHMSFNNSTGTHNTYSGINVESGIQNFIITGCVCGTGGFEQASGVANYQSYGIQLQTSSTTAEFLITYNRCPGNVNGGFINGSTGANQTVIGNTAY